MESILSDLSIHGNQGKTKVVEEEEGAEETDVQIPLVLSFLVLMTLVALIPMESEFLVGVFILF